MDIAKRFGENVAGARNRAGVSQEELAFIASLHRTEIGMVERGTRLARIDTLVKLAAALSMAPGDLLEGITWLPGEMQLGRFQIDAQPDRSHR